MAEAERERYADPRAFAREVNLPLLGEVSVAPVPAGSPLADLLRSEVPPSVAPVVESLTQTRTSLTLRSLLLAGFAHDPELFALGLALAREWTRRGLRIALVDLDFWSPTIVRPSGSVNEGLIDMLEFGCSFRRVAWEIVADRLWLVSPGTYLPDADRVADHPDWDRAARVMSAQVDVAIYVAPLLERGRFLARLSKRMDGVLLASSVVRAPRTRLRDAFLELWGSDAPMIGCIGLVPAPAAAAGAPPAAPAAEAGSPRRSARDLEGHEEPEPATAAALAAAESFARAREARRAASPTVVVEPPLHVEDAAPPTPRAPAAGAREDADLIARIEAEARANTGPEPHPMVRARLGVWLSVVAAVLVTGSAGVYFLHLAGVDRRGAGFKETQPTGIERILPAQLGAPSSAGPVAPSSGGPAASGSPAEGAGSAPPASARPGTAVQSPPALKPPAPESPALAPPAPASPKVAREAPSPGASALKPASAPPGRAAGAGISALPYRVHVASFRSEATVRRLASELSAKGLAAWYEPASGMPGWYRVFVGHFATHAEAAAEAERLLHTGFVQRAKAFPDDQR